MCFKQFGILPAVLLALVCGCTVLEDRTDCPMRLYLILDDSGNMVCDSLAVRVSSVKGFRYSSMVGSDEYKNPLCIPVPDKSGMLVSVVDGGAAQYFEYSPAEGYDIPVGTQCPRAYMYNSFIETSEEEYPDSVRVTKNYCTAAVDFIAGDLKKYSVRIYGSISGFSADGRPKPGVFVCSPEMDGDTTSFSIRLPRQTDSSLEMGICAPGSVERRFALGNYIKESGYDWTKTNLEDLCIRVDYAATSVTIFVNGWSVKELFDIVL